MAVAVLAVAVLSCCRRTISVFAEQDVEITRRCCMCSYRGSSLPYREEIEEFRPHATEPGVSFCIIL
jgi:hypothetical protein